MTKVPQAPDYVLGILNLRGQIVTIIDLERKLGLGDTDISKDPRNIIVNSARGHVGLLVKRISDNLLSIFSRTSSSKTRARGCGAVSYALVHNVNGILLLCPDDKG